MSALKLLKNFTVSTALFVLFPQIVTGQIADSERPVLLPNHPYLLSGVPNDGPHTTSASPNFSNAAESSPTALNTTSPEPLVLADIIEPAEQTAESVRQISDDPLVPARVSPDFSLDTTLSSMSLTASVPDVESEVIEKAEDTALAAQQETDDQLVVEDAEHLSSFAPQTVVEQASLTPIRPTLPLNIDASTAQESASPGALELTQAVESAVYTHPSVRQAIGFMGQAIENIDVAKAGYYPQVQGGVRSEYDDSGSNSYNRNMVQKAVVSASQMLYDFGKVSSSVDQAQARQVAAHGRVLLSIDEVAQETAYAFIESQRYQTLTVLAQDQVERVSAIADLARERRALGASTLSDETQARSREASARATLLDMASQVERWKKNLSYLSGLDQIESLSPDVPDVFELSCVAETPAWDLLPEVLVAEAESAEAVAALDNANAQLLPTLSIEGTMGRALNASTPSGSRNEATAMLNLSMPFYQGGSTRAQKRAARSALSAAEAAANSARLSASQNLIEARNRTRGYQQRIGALAERIESILLTRDLYREQYLSLGTRTLLDLLNAEQEYHQARFENANNIHDMRRMQVDCLYNSGRMREAFALGSLNVGDMQTSR